MWCKGLKGVLTQSLLQGKIKTTKGTGNYLLTAFNEYINGLENIMYLHGI